MEQFLIWFLWVTGSPLTSCFLFGVNLSLLVLNARFYQRIRRLDHVLFELATNAWMMRHLPIWVPWSELSQVNFTVTLEPRKGRRS
jgi:hypothetical protein